MVTGSPAPPLEGDSGTLHVRLLGDLQVRVGGEPLGALRSGRARSLLAFLVLHADVAHARQRLAFEFWPDSSEAQARTNLRNVLHTLRRAHPALEAAAGDDHQPAVATGRADGGRRRALRRRR